MYRTLLNTLSAEISGDAAKNLVARICQWHRIQASPMYREAAHWLNDTLQGWGLESALEEFPAREGARAWAEPMFQEWSCEGATLDLIEADGATRRLCDYRAVPLSLLPRSLPAEGEYEVVVIDGGTSEADYDGSDVRGKLVLTRAMPMAVHPLAIERFGAAGVIFDGMRAIPELCPPGDLQDAIQYASWWWWGGETRAFGFALSPRAGSELRQLIARRHRAEQPVRVRAVVRSQFSDGSIEAVSAVIRGQSDEQVLLVGHLCHPAPCANDNASGAAAVMECARALHALVERGALPRPRRSIRFLWVPEMTGTFAYCAAHQGELAGTVAGLNLDMVGEDQTQTGSVWLVARTPESTPSFASDLLEALREGMFAGGHGLNGHEDYPLFRHAVTPFSNGSDHYILSDPSVGVPTPMLIEWPDRFYHTTADTLEKVSPASLHRSALLAATYAYAVANAGARDAQWLAREMNARFERRLSAELQAALTAALSGQAPQGPSWQRRVAFRLDRQTAALSSLQRLDAAFDPQPAQATASQIALACWARNADLLEGWAAPAGATLSDDDAALVPVRRYPGPISLRSHLYQLPPEERSEARAIIRRHGGFMGLHADLSLYWADGRRSLAEILDLVELEAGAREPAALVAYMRLLERLELLTLQ